MENLNKIEFIAEFAEAAIKEGQKHLGSYVGWTLANHIFGGEAVVSKAHLKEKVFLPMNMRICAAKRYVKAMQDLGFAENRGHSVKLKDLHGVGLMLIGKSGFIPQNAIDVNPEDLTLDSDGQKSWSKIKGILTTNLRNRCGHNKMPLEKMGELVGASKCTMRRWSRSYSDTIVKQYKVVGRYTDPHKAAARLEELNGGKSKGRYLWEHCKKTDKWAIKMRIANKYSNSHVKFRKVANRADIQEVNELASILSPGFEKNVASKVRRKLKRLYGPGRSK